MLKFYILNNINCFLKKYLMLTKAVFIWYKKYEILFQFKISFLYEYILKCNLFFCCKAESSASLLSSVSHDLSEIILIWWFSAKKNIFCYYHCWKWLCCFTFIYLFKNNFVKTIVLFQDTLMHRMFKRTAFIWNINVKVFFFILPKTFEL